MAADQADVVREVWNELLDVEAESDTQADFFSLGGTSLLAMAFIQEIESRLLIEFPAEILYSGATLKQVIDICEERSLA